jgi:GrpB-like predicted nucleotidyltransferase (UPF0157 family)
MRDVMVEVVTYDARWPLQFDELKAFIWPTVAEVAVSIEHVGSTSVPGLAAKPVIDLDIVVRDQKSVGKVVLALRELGYVHRGDLGIEGREAFFPPEGRMRHNLYVCLEGCTALNNHLILRDYLRAHPDARDEYGQIKMSLAREFPDSLDDYIEGKTAFILKVLERALTQEQLESIRVANLAPKNRK